MKRFTETNKWADPWYRALSPKHKTLWQYLLDTCDIAGCLKADIDWALVSFQVGQKCDQEDLAAFSGRIEEVNGYLWIRKFCLFQYGVIKEDTQSRVHRSVISTLDRVGIPLAKAMDSLSIPFTKPIDRLKDKDKDKDKDNTEGVQGEVVNQIYEAYPRKERRKDAIRAIESQIKAGVDPVHLLERTSAYAAAMQRKHPDGDYRYVPHPARWFNQGSFDDDPRMWEPTGKPQPHQPGLTFV